ncbi:hypothetical protein BG011_007938 [Mortierella polycephala]|uniref:PH domain-containing protein n=1 Tax=Mortierella polycephala TaxID=41804 RepID=A0A9P6U8K8_9FUNG|nr:hypothetical protein BG011_007938 [Mortierella polycephala]
MSKEVSVTVEVNVTEEADKTPVAEATTAATSTKSEEEEDEDIDITDGYLQKRGTNPIHPWNKRYFAFGTTPIDLTNLQTVHKRNERRVKASSKTTAAAAETPSEVAAGKAPATDAPATAEGDAATSTAVVATPAPKSVEEVYEEANRDMLVNVAQANTKGTGLLFYHKSEDELHRQNILGIINLRDVNAVERVEKSSKNRSFVVSTKNRDYHFSAESPQKAKGWVKAIKEKTDEAKAEDDPYRSPQFQEVYKKLVAREAFKHAVNSANIVSDNEINSDGEPDEIEIENGTPIVKKRKSFFGFSAVTTSHEKKRADGVATEVKTEQKQDLTHVQDGDVDALKTHESSNAVSHTTDAPAGAAAAEAPKSPKAKSGGFKLFGKKSPKTEEPPTPPAEPELSVDDAKAKALKAVDDAVEASKAKAAEAKANTPPPPPTPEKKPGFFDRLFQKKPAPPPAPVVAPNEETIVVSSEKTVSDVVTAEGAASSQSNAGFFSRVTTGQDKKEVEVKSAEISSEDIVTAEGSTHVEHIEGTNASVEEVEGDMRVDLSTTDETVATADKNELTIQDKVDRKPSLLKRLSGAVRATITPSAAATEAVQVETTVVEETETKAETAETADKETKVVEVAPVVAVEAAA